MKTSRVQRRWGGAIVALGVAVLGWKTSRLPAFYWPDSGLPVTERVESAAEVAAIARARTALGVAAAILVTVPIPAAAALDPDTAEAAVAEAVAATSAAGTTGWQSTPAVLARLTELTSGRSLAANRALLVHNAGVAATIAAALAGGPAG